MAIRLTYYQRKVLRRYEIAAPFTMYIILTTYKIENFYHLEKPSRKILQLESIPSLSLNLKKSAKMMRFNHQLLKKLKFLRPQGIDKFSFVF